MTADLNQRLSNLGDHLDRERGARDQDRPVAQAAARPTYSRRELRWTRPLAAAACGLMIGLAGLAGIGYLRLAPENDAIEVGVRSADGPVQGAGAEVGPAATEHDFGQEIAVDQTATVRTDDCVVRVRAYNATGIGGLATRFSQAINERIDANDSVRGTTLPPRHGPLWDGDTAWLVGPDAACFDLSVLGLNNVEDALVGDLDELWSRIGLSSAAGTIDDEDATTIVIVLGFKHAS